MTPRIGHAAAVQVEKCASEAAPDPMSASPTIIRPSEVSAESIAMRQMRNGLLFCGCVAGAALVSALFLKKGLLLSSISDLGTLTLAMATALLVARNAARSKGQVRSFWIFAGLGMGLWIVSLCLWNTYELVLQRPVPDLPFADMLLFVKLVPMIAALAIEPDRPHDTRFRAFSLLDVSIFIAYALYLYVLCVFSYRLLPSASDQYDLRFNVADAIGNGIFVLAAGYGFMGAKGAWKKTYGFLFLSALAYCVASNLSNIAIDRGTYYSGSLYDVPLLLAHAAFFVFAWSGAELRGPEKAAGGADVARDQKSSELTAILAMTATLSIPVIGLFLLLSSHQNPLLAAFRLKTTISMILLITLLVALKQHLLTDSLVTSLQSCSEAYRRIHRYKDQLSQSERLAALGAAVAQVANEIKDAMGQVRQRSREVSNQSGGDERVLSMAGKIGQYALRTDALVENMLRFAQETPLDLRGVQVKTLMESAMHLCRIAKLPGITVELREDGAIPKVLADSGQLLHVFFQVLSNSIDALEDVGGGKLEILIARAGLKVKIEIADSGPGLREPERVFEPFYTTKPVGKGTGLGLSTCYGIIQQHGGEITCRNRDEGGAVFSITLPAVFVAEAPVFRAESILTEER